MARTLLFVHGTGVRGRQYAETMALVERQVQEADIPVKLMGCYWGDAEGARLAASGRSIPGYSETGGGEPSEADRMLALWSILYTDPWYELRLMRHLSKPGVVPFGQEPPAVVLLRQVREFEPSAPLVVALRRCGLEYQFAAGLAALREASELEQAAATAPNDPIDHRRAIARALIAYASLAATSAGAAQIDGSVRDSLALQVTNELHGYGLGVSDLFLQPFKGLAKRVGTRKLTANRGALTDAAAPFAGDVMRFLARGDGVRKFVRLAVEDAGGDVYILAHSLGGLICVDLLLRGVLSQVKGLITVGSQAPFLYEIGAYPSLEPPALLPVGFPPWLNLFDRRDILSYVGSGVFGDQVVDIEVDNDQPFPESHSAYWSNPSVWMAVKSFLR